MALPRLGFALAGADKSFPPAETVAAYRPEFRQGGLPQTARSRVFTILRELRYITA
jgi:hypothetical protein